MLGSVFGAGSLITLNTGFEEAKSLSAEKMTNALGKRDNLGALTKASFYGLAGSGVPG